LEFHEKKGLPAGSEKKVRPGYEEIHMPAPAKPQVSAYDLVDISDLEEWAQLAFPNID
jgi:pre-mRNA-splicing helicase BRR2